MSFPTADEDGFGPEDVIRLTGVSRETLDLTMRYLDLLDQWRERINLIGPSEGRHIWRRHVLDSLQLAPLLGDGPVQLADLGSGAGFPGVLLACVLAERPGASVALIEKSPRKSEFLAAAIEALDLPASVLTIRAEEAPERAFDLITARALAPLPKLLGYAARLLKPSGKALLLKGRETGSELTLARESWTYHLSEQPSLSSPEGRVLVLSSLAPTNSQRRTS